VAATIFPLADIVRQVGGSAVDVATVLPAGASPHAFEPSPTQVRELARAIVVVKVGMGLDDWLDRLLAAGERTPTIVVVTRAVPVVDGDPHVWLDPVLVRDRIVPAVGQALVTAAPAAAARVTEGVSRFSRELTALNDEITTRTGRFRRREFVAAHGAWRYFARRYGLREVGVLEESPGKEPSAAALAALVEAGRAAGVRAILAEPQAPPRLANVLASELKARVVVVDPLGGAGLSGRDSYVGLMRWNLSAFAEALE
jgi:ABC-type Zn uptake system ZnuABC Zn-binding protein ZnuA